MRLHNPAPWADCPGGQGVLSPELCFNFAGPGARRPCDVMMDDAAMLLRYEFHVLFFPPFPFPLAGWQWQKWNVFFLAHSKFGSITGLG